MIKWLFRRLTTAKGKEARWADLATAIEGVWEEYFDPCLSRLERLRSSYLADDQDLVRKIRQMGDYFSFEFPNEADRPIALAWRRLELEYKDTELILRSVFRRHFGNMSVNWLPIFAPVDIPYGTAFIPADGPWPEIKNSPPDGMFLTSRGVLGIDLSCIFGLHLSKQEFLDRAEPLLLRTKPLHIVYDGPLWYIRFDIPFEAAFELVRHETMSCFELQFSTIGSRFDIIPADERPLDNDFVCSWESHKRISIPFISGPPYWRLDTFLPLEGIPEHWLPLDIAIPGAEDESSPLLTTVFAETIIQGIKCNFSCCLNQTDKLKKRILHPVKFPVVSVNASSVNESHSSITFNIPELDQLPCFDDIPADFMPLDSCGGYFHA